MKSKSSLTDIINGIISKLLSWNFLKKSNPLQSNEGIKNSHGNILVSEQEMDDILTTTQLRVFSEYNKKQGKVKPMSNSSKPQMSNLEAENERLKEKLNQIVLWCEDPDFRAQHTGPQMRTFLDGVRKYILDGNKPLPLSIQLPSNDEVYRMVSESKGNFSTYVSANAVNDVMAAVRTWMTGKR